MTFASVADKHAIEAQMPWAERDIPATLYGLMSRTTQKFPDKPAVSFQLFSGPKDKAETLSWRQLHDKTVQTANLFRKLSIGEKDVVAYILPNCNEAMLAFLGGAIAGIVNPPSKKKYGHWTNADLSLSPEDWEAGAQQHEGSWWPMWGDWLAKKSGKKIDARTPGSATHPPLTPAPGTYVLRAKVE